MPRAFRECPRLTAVALTAALLLTVIGAVGGAGLASGGEGMSLETAGALERIWAAERQAVRELRDTRAALRRAREEARTERRRAGALGRQADDLNRSNRKLRRAVRRELR
jgi:uncharacterized membrane protein